MKIIGIFLVIIGFLVVLLFLIMGSFLLHPYLGWIAVGGVCLLIGNMIYDNYL